MFFGFHILPEGTDMVPSSYHKASVKNLNYAIYFSLGYLVYIFFLGILFSSTFCQMTSNNFLPDSINENFVELRLPFIYLQLLRKLEKYVTNSSYHLYWLQQLQLRWNHFPATFLLQSARG